MAAALVAGCSPSPPGAQPDRPTAPKSRSAAQSPTADPDAPTGWGPTQGELAEAGQLVAAMSPEQRVTQVMMPAFWGYAADRPTPSEAARNRDSHGTDTAARAITLHRYGGTFVRPETIESASQVRSLVDGLHAAGDGPDGLPMLVSVDQEGGDVQRIKAGATRWPSARTIGRTGDPLLARTVARGNGDELRAMGFTMALAPVADINTADNAIVGSRSFSSDYTEGAAMVVASVRGYLDAGIIPVVKHFPGHGSVVGDSHRSLPVQRKSVDELMRTDLVPFAAAIKAGVPAVMTGHIEVPAVQPGVPASTSKGIVTGLLRDRLGFRGVAITDSQGMGPVYGAFGNAESAVRSLLAGNDLILNSPDANKARRGVLRAVRSGRLPEARLVESATRVVALRIYQRRLGAHRPPMSVVGSRSHAVTAARAAG